jgi:tRNA A37 methylthiotransferase MiaB
MKKISFVSAQFKVQYHREQNEYILPYNSGLLWEYAKLHGIEEYFELDKLIFKRENHDFVVEQLKDSDVIGFSTYVWNKVYHYNLAKAIKEKYPEKIIIFGGPEPAINRPEFINSHKFIDYFVIKEGEITLTNLLKNLDSSARFKIPGLIINLKSGFLDTGEPERIRNLENIPSPYLTGFFDKIIKENPDITWSATLEMDRGCPYQCTFCDWGSLTYSKVAKFPMEKIFDELEWFGKNKISFMYATNANFGIFGERDLMITDKILEVNKKYNGYPKSLFVSFAKNNKEYVTKIFKKISTMPDALNIAHNIALQSTTDDVLSAIKRKNLEISNAKEIFEYCEQQNIIITSELILGLPEETLQSWKNNFYKLYELGNHTRIPIYQAQLLENAEMNLSQRKEYNMTTVKSYDFIIPDDPNDPHREYIEIVTSTKNMPHEDMLKAQVWSWFMQTFHMDGLTRYISRFLRKYLNVEYSDFYEKFYVHIDSNAWWKTKKEEMFENYKMWMKDGEIESFVIDDNMEITGSFMHTKTIFDFFKENKHDETLEMIKQFVKNNYDLPEDIFDELFLFQKLYVPTYENFKNYPILQKFNYDIHGYVIHDKKLNVKKFYRFSYPNEIPSKYHLLTVNEFTKKYMSRSQHSEITDVFEERKTYFEK